MKLILDDLNALTGWSASGTASVYGTNNYKGYIAGNNDTSIVMRFEAIGDYVEKIYNQDITNYDFVTVWLHSIRKGRDDYRGTEEYSYKIDLGTGKEYYLAAYKNFALIKINVADITTLDRVRISALTTGEDYLVLSYLVLSKDEFPYDFFTSIKEQLEYNDSFILSNPVLGNISGTTGDTTISFSAPVAYLQRYCAVKIEEGANSETHTIADIISNTEFLLSEQFDGPELTNDYTNATVTLLYPITFGNTEEEIILPSVTIWGFASGELIGTNDLDRERQRVDTAGITLERQKGKYIEWMFTVDCSIQKHWDLLEIMATWVRKTIQKRELWINGYKAYITQIEKPNEIGPVDVDAILPKIQFSFLIELREELYSIESLPKTTAVNIDVVIQSL